MTIRLNCSCGNALQVRADYVGKRMKCPACGHVLVVPRQEEGTAFVPEPESPAAPAATAPRARVAVACSCGRTFDVDATQAGRHTACPECGQRMIVPRPGTAAPVWDDAELSPPPPRSPRRLRKAWVAGGVAAGVILLAAGGLAAWKLQPEEKPRPRGRELALRPPMGAVSAQVIGVVTLTPPSDELDLLRPRTAGFVSLRVANLWASPAGQSIRRQLAREEPEFLPFLEGQLGLNPAGIERLLLILPEPDPATACLAVAMREPYEQARIARALTPGAASRLAEGNRSQAAGDPGLRVHYHNELVILFGTKDAIQLVQKSPRMTPDAASLSQSVRAAEGADTLVAGFSSTRWWAGYYPGPGVGALAGIANRPELQPLGIAREAIVTANFRDELEVVVEGLYRDEGQAGQAAQALPLGQQLALDELGRWQKDERKDVRAALLAPLLEPLPPLLRDLSGQQHGPALRVSLRLRQETAIGLLVYLFKTLKAAFPSPQSS